MHSLNHQQQGSACAKGGGERVPKGGHASRLGHRRLPHAVVVCVQGRPGGGAGYPTPSSSAPQQQPAYRPGSPYQQPYYQPQEQLPPVQATPLPPRRTTAALVPTQQQQPLQPSEIYLDFSLVSGKQVITRTQGRNLGTVTTAWVDPQRYEVVSLDIDDKKTVGSRVGVANVPLSRLTQIGDVVLVDDSSLYEPPMDGRFGYYILSGMEVRTRSGDFLGKVRDFSFSPDTGAISRIIYDDFGLSFLPVAFFDTYSIPMSDVIGVGPSGLIVLDEAKYRERRESAGVFTAIPSLLRSFNSNSTRSQGMLTDGYRADSGGPAGYLPQGYGWAQWENDVRRWEMETGLSYEQYTMQQKAAKPLPSPRTAALPSGASSPSPQYGYATPVTPRKQPQQQNPYAYGQQYPAQAAAARRPGGAPADPRVRVGGGAGPGVSTASQGRPLPPPATSYPTPDASRQPQYAQPAAGQYGPAGGGAGGASGSGRGPTPQLQQQLQPQQPPQQQPLPPQQQAGGRRPPGAPPLQQQPQPQQQQWGGAMPGAASGRTPPPQQQGVPSGNGAQQQQQQQQQPMGGIPGLPPQQQPQQRPAPRQPQPQQVPRAALTSDVQQPSSLETNRGSSPSAQGPGSSNDDSSSSSSNNGGREMRQQFENWLGRDVTSPAVQELELLEADASWRPERSSNSMGGEGGSSWGSYPGPRQF
mmetsp:Transcript_11824/g.32279  ORF Transcript_11824/g.32279 Transcript_11824/m.32279 type:complete len:696 (+) Transcript_11824:48-2135(+)|eukprot:CAMPEP_0202392812 /NCGR_PEP_ID=MMETSP1127-20130417/92579_1 /ASSEMBLY_ACC=CAM_ASM_000462 /TAXON_ID=3047 /ORGANISM="Dunaliella tertiolecta, Strain CCMP1320" /LENGTH=695 /DNA_ID=CAMNT_0048995355 /DNA_START=472 /DNA_END=2559 /DNA_ORIENTATION=-